jgi:uncharacterized protein YciI
MRNIIIILLSGFLLWSCNPSEKEMQTTVLSEVNDYDSLLAQQYGADQYGMHKYVIAFLKRGPNRSKDSAEAAQLQRAHLENINRLAEEGKLVLAGPFFGDGDLRGIYVFDVQTVEEAKALTETDPSIQKGVLVMELHEWYGSAAVMAIPEIHKKLEQVNVGE